MRNKVIAYRRLCSQGITWNKERTPFGVVQSLGAVQAQDYSQALWAIGSRMQDANVSEVEQAIVEKEIVLTWVMRGTLHFVPAEDVRWMIKLLTPRVLIKARKRLDQMELDSKQIALGEKIIYDALKENKRMSRPSLMKILDEAGIHTQNGRGYHLLWYLAQTGLLCLAPMEEKQQTFVLMDYWLHVHQNLTLEDSLSVLAKRYFKGHGPATIHDFAWWSGLTIAEANHGIEAAQEHLISEKIEGLQYWMSKEEATAIEENPMVSLLAGYDEYLLGYKDRSAVLKDEYAPLISGRNAVFAPMLVVDGEVAGIWKRAIKKDRIDITVRPFYELGSRKEYILDAAQQYSKFVNLTVSQIVIEEV